jgi:Fur family ferric uptake transcriptional regulator
MLEEKKIRETPFRLELIKIFNKTNNAISTKEIEKQLNDFDRVTLYRTLKLFIEKGIIHEVLVSNGKKYALCKEQCGEHRHEHNHLHFHCSTCDKSFCVETDITKINLPGYIIKHADFNLHGICNKCNN